MTTFKLISKKTGLALNAPLGVSNPNETGLVGQLYTDTNTDNNYWQFLLDENFCFQIVNYQTQMALLVGIVAPVWHSTSHAGVNWPVMEAPQVNSAAGQESSNYSPQEWTVRPPTPGSPSYGQGYFELVVSPIQTTQFHQWVMNVPDHLIGANNVHVVLQVSPGNGGQDNEQWTLVNTASPQPSIRFVNTTEWAPSATAGFFMNVAGSGFTPGSSVTVYSLAVLSIEGLSSSNPTTVDANGNFVAQLFENAAFGAPPSPPPPAPNAGQVTLVAVNENGYALAFGTVDLSYFT